MEIPITVYHFVDDDTEGDTHITIKISICDGDDNLDVITGFTWMDNFDMEMYLRDFVKVADEHIIWDKEG